MFRAMDDPYMRERSADVKDVSERLIKILSGKDKVGLVTDEPVIIISDDLAPSETVQFDKSKILAFVTLYKFSYINSCKNDEYSRNDWCKGRFVCRCKRQKCHC